MSGKPTEKTNHKNNRIRRVVCPERFSDTARNLLYTRNMAGAYCSGRCDCWHRHRLSDMEKQGQMVRR